MKYEELKNLRREAIPLAEEIPLNLDNAPTGFKAIRNPDTKQIYTVVTDGYQLIQHRDVFDQLAQLKKYTLGESAIYKGGSVMALELLHKDRPERELLSAKDKFEPRVRIINSYDASHALTVQAYGLRLVCTNGMIAPGFSNNYTSRDTHINNTIDLDTLASKIELAMSTWDASASMIRASALRRVNIDYAIHKVGKFPQKYAEEVKGHLKPNFDTLYNVWNAFTDVISHDMKSNVQTGTLIKYQQRANKLFSLLNDPNAEADWDPATIPETEEEPTDTERGEMDGGEA